MTRNKRGCLHDEPMSNDALHLNDEPRVSIRSRVRVGVIRAWDFSLNSDTK